MDASRVLIIVGYYAAAYVLCCVLSMVVIGSLLRSIIRKELPDYRGPESQFFSIARLVGSLEQIMYITAILIGEPAFIGVWLVVKVVDDARHSAKAYSVFLAGTSLSLIFAVAMALLIQQLLPPFPSLHQWRLPTP